jgi:Domain of unknown function (DUF4153)
VKFFSRVPEQLRSLGRFPVSVAVSVFLTVLVNLRIAHFISVSELVENEITFASAAAFLAALIATLWFESRRLSAIASVVVGVVLAALAALLQFSHGNAYGDDLVAVGGLILATMVAAHIRRGAKIVAFWMFDLQLGVAAAMGLLALLIVCSGLSLLLASCRYLFDVIIPDSTYNHIWATGAWLLGPLFALAMIPTEVDEPFIAGAKPDLIEKSVFYLLNFALAPLALVYAVMLHIYAAKIAITANMPKGEIGWLVLTFGALGTATYMIAYPWRDVGFRPVRWFIRSWFWLMVIPTILLIVAVSQRIAQYGVTPERYFLCLFAIWLAAMVVYMGAARGKIDLRAIPACLAVALLLSSFGPWGTTSVSIRSQLGEFYRVLNSKGVLVDGRLKLGQPRVEKFAQLVASDKRLSSILNSLYDLGALNRIQFIFAGADDDPFRANPADDHLRRVLGMEGLEMRSREGALGSQPAIGFEPGASIAFNLDVGGYDLMAGPVWLSRQGQINVGDLDSPPIDSDAKVGVVSLQFSDSVLTASRAGASVSFNLAKAMEPVLPTVKSPIIVPAHEGRDRAILVLVPPSETANLNRPKKFEMWLLLNTKSMSSVMR